VVSAVFCDGQQELTDVVLAQEASMHDIIAVDLTVCAGALD